jgi:cephalosporin hydroxylase
MKPQTNTTYEYLKFCPELQSLVRNRRVVGRTGKTFEGLGALSSFNNLAVLRNLCLHLSPKRTLEIGLSFGGSALVFTSCHRDLGHSPARQHIAIDPFQKTVWDDCGLLMAEQAGLSAYLDFRSAFSCLELPTLIRDGQEIDIAYIDGSHLFEDVFLDFYYVSRLLNDGKLVLFDDSSNPHVRKVLRFIHTNNPKNFTLFDLGPYRADQGRSFKYRIGGLMGIRQLVAFKKIGDSERRWDSTFINF